MDRDQAKFILSSFRPDGADADSEDFTEALRLAAADRELGEWLAKERALDAEFAGALAKSSLPEELRDEILGSLAAGRGDEPERDDHDFAFADALSGIRPPQGLRAEVLVAMESSAPRKAGWRWALPLAAAAGIVLALVLTNEGPFSSGNPTIAGAVPIAHVEAAAIKTLTSPDFSFEEKSSDHEKLFQFIRSKGRACPAGCIPAGLKEVDSLGCRTLKVDGKPGAIVCFLRGENDVVHLVVFRGDDVDASVANDADPKVEQHGDWAVAKWAEKGRVFLLMGNTDAENLGKLF